MAFKNTYQSKLWPLIGQKIILAHQNELGSMIMVNAQAQ
jgi:hypothetical protein